MTDESRTLLVTGASSGIGQAIATRLLAQGHTVIGVARNFNRRSGKDDSLQTASSFHAIELDLEDIDELPARLAALHKKHPAIDGLVCCAGRGLFGSLEECSFAQIRSLMELNFLSQAYLAKTFIPALKKRGKGDLIFIASEAALRGSRKGSVYCASKFAVRGFAQALREECSRSGVRVSVINPGMVKTGFFSELDFRPGDDEDNYISATDVAEAVHMVLSARHGTNFDEINLSPLKKVILFSRDS